VEELKKTASTVNELTTKVNQLLNYNYNSEIINYLKNSIADLTETVNQQKTTINDLTAIVNDQQNAINALTAPTN